MKRVAIVASLLVTAFASAQAATYNDQARVRRVEPQYENISVPRNECRSQWVNEEREVYQQRQDPNYGGVILGGLAGGVLGNQVGRGHGREAATAVGAVVGALTGNYLAGPQRGQYVAPREVVQREVQTCRTVNDNQSRLTGYRVNYEYNGQHYQTVTRTDPGPTLAVRVSVDPIER